jgi:cytidylate kinase
MSEVITIDGPAASGKSSVGLRLAEKLGYQFVDSGSIYRAACYYFLHHNLSWSDPVKAAEVVDSLKFHFVVKEDSLRVFVGDEDYTDFLNSPEVTHLVPTVFGVIREVRQAVKAKQHSIASTENTIMTGRDTGTEIFPDAKVKFFINASPEVRAERRFKQLMAAGKQADYQEIVKSLIERDERDRTREVSPFRIAVDAIEINTDELSIEEAVTKMYDIVKSRGL